MTAVDCPQRTADKLERCSIASYSQLAACCSARHIRIAECLQGSKAAAMRSWDST